MVRRRACHATAQLLAYNCCCVHVCRWNGAHCILNGFAKEFQGCNPKLPPSLTPFDMTNRSDQLTVVTLSCGGGVRVGMLPDSFFNTPRLYGAPMTARVPSALIARSPKPAQRDRLRLDRYDAQDFAEIVSAMKAEGLWVAQSP